MYYKKNKKTDLSENRVSLSVSGIILESHGNNKSRIFSLNEPSLWFIVNWSKINTFQQEFLESIHFFSFVKIYFLFHFLINSYLKNYEPHPTLLFEFKKKEAS